MDDDVEGLPSTMEVDAAGDKTLDTPEARSLVYTFF